MKKPLEGKSILIVDDEPDLCDVLEDDFRSLGADVRIASCGIDAFDLFNEKAPHLILSDVRMSRGDGVELLEWVRSKSPAAPPHFLFLSGYSNIQADQAIALGSQGLITKPFSLKSLREQVIALCNEL